ncbi:MAG: hypothetical protein Q4B67_03000 [Eubacteriales bacterium]|nr:hypothetical protein [Eubacteriales bacterium]
MDRRKTRRKRQSAIKETFSMVNTILLVVIAAAIVAFVVFFIKGQMNGGAERETSFLSGLFGDHRESQGETTEIVIETEAETLADGINKSKDGSLYFLKNGERLTNTWIDHEGKLYRADSNGFLITTESSEGAYNYIYTPSGEVKSIRYNPSYSAGDSRTENDRLEAGLTSAQTMGELSLIMYKRKTDNYSHKLGGDKAPQYTSGGSLQIAGDYIYWLPWVRDPDEMEATVNGRLFRMKPGEEKRQVLSENVLGFKVLETENGTVIYYYDNFMHRAEEQAFKDDEFVMTFTEDMEYVVSLGTDGKLYLMTKNGYPVTMETEAFKANGFYYALNAKGEITFVREEKYTVIDGCRYSIASQNVFGTMRSCVVRKGLDGKEYIISGDFEGTGGNMYVNPYDGFIYAEHTTQSGACEILKISPDGDIDILSGSTTQADSLRLVGFADSKVFAKKISGGTSEIIVYDSMLSSALTIAVEPKPYGEQETTAAGPGMGPGDATGPGSPSYGPGSEMITGPGQAQPQTQPQTQSFTQPETQSYGPGSPMQVQIPDEPVTVSP